MKNGKMQNQKLMLIGGLIAATAGVVNAQPMNNGSGQTLREMVEQSTNELRVQNGAMDSGAMSNGAMSNGAMSNGAMSNSAMDNGMKPSSMMAQLGAMDQLFVVRAGEGNLAEVTFSQLALKKSRDAGVRAVAQKLIEDHGKAQDELMQVARGKGMMLAPKLSATHQTLYESLSKMKGAAFDKHYMACQVGDHENTVALFQTELDGGQDSDIKGFADKFLTPIVGHTVMIYKVARQVGAPGMEMRPAMPPTPPGVDADKLKMEMDKMNMEMNAMNDSMQH